MRIVKGPQRFGSLVFGVDVLAHVAGGAVARGTPRVQSPP